MTYNEEFTERVKKEQIHPKLCLTIKILGIENNQNKSFFMEKFQA